MSNLSTVTHFEIFAADPANLARFYRELFAWRIDKADGVDYYHIQTGQTGQTGTTEANGIGGGLLYRPIAGPRSWVHYVRVPSLDQTVERLLKLGGAVLRPKTAVPKTAWSAVLEDPEGNVCAVWQCDPSAMPSPEPD